MLLLLMLAQDFETFRREAMRKEDEGLWKKIEWTTMDEAKAAGRPILVFMVVGKYGRPDAKDC